MLLRLNSTVLGVISLPDKPLYIILFGNVLVPYLTTYAQLGLARLELLGDGCHHFYLHIPST